MAKQMDKKIFTALILNLVIFTSFQNIQAGALIMPKLNGISQSTNTSKDFLGKWNMQTIVTKSSCPYVIVGTTTESNLEISQLPPEQSNSNSASLKAFWNGGAWTKSNGTIKLLNNKEAVSERVTEFKTKDQDNWKAILIDHLKLTENNTILSESIVIQYKNGINVGEYKTYSILTKAEP